jgi:hypothetical protein
VKDTNVILAEILKLLMNGGYGKFSQKIHDENEVITDNVTSVDGLYIKYQANVIHDITLQNGYQCAIKYISSPKHVKFPVHLSSFILSYSQKRMNYIVNEVDGFTNWNNTFYYADTDSLFLPHHVAQMLENKHPELFGKKLGQLHNDIEEVKEGRVIGAIFLAPKTYILEIFGIDLVTGDYTIAYHVRGKGVRNIGEKLTFEKFEKMLKENSYELTNEWHFESKPNQLLVRDKDPLRGMKSLLPVPALKRIDNPKVTNGKPYSGRLPWNASSNRREPFNTKEERGATQKWAEEISRMNQVKINLIKKDGKAKGIILQS